MDPMNGERMSELLQAQAHVWNHIFNFINSMCLKCAIQLGIADIIHNHAQPVTLTDLISELQIPPSKSHCVHRLMRILIHSGFFEEKMLESSDQTGYVLNHPSRLLLRENPFSIAPFALAMLDPMLTNPWHHLSAWFENTDLTPFKMAHGLTFWNYSGQDPSLNRFFHGGMDSDARLMGSLVVSECKGVFEGIKKLVDVGGGTGIMAKAIAAAFPNIECTVLDLPHVVANTEESKNVRYVAGDMFEAVPAADAILMKWIIHDWGDEDSVKILKRCREALIKGKGKKLIIIDIVMGNKEGDNREEIETQLFFDMLMMVLNPGKERNEREWAELFTDAGFKDYKITPILGLRSFIEVYLP